MTAEDIWRELLILQKWQQKFPSRDPDENRAQQEHKARLVEQLADLSKSRQT